MRKIVTVLLLSAALVSTGTGPLERLTPAAVAAEATGPVITSPLAGAQYKNRFNGPIRVDLSNGGAADPSHTFEVSYRNGSGTWQLLTTLSGTAVQNDVALPSALGPGDYTVRVDPTWLDDTHTVSTQFTVAYDPYVWLYVNDGGQSFPQDQVSIDAVLGYVNAGETVDWNIRRDEACGGGELPSCDPVASGTITATGRTSQTVRLPVTSLPEGDYEVTVYRAVDPWNDRADAWFTVLPAPTLTGLSTAPATFYPLVRDGYRDRTTLTWRQNVTARTTVSVMSGTKAVRRVRLGSLAAGRHTWAWDGRTNSGAKAAKGSYRIVVAITDPSGAVDTAASRVELATTTITRRGLIERLGNRTTARSKRGNCFFHGYDGELTLDCWSGTHAQATYVYRIPRKAFDVRHVVYGENNCCDQGRLTITGRRTSPTRYVTTVRVTDWRSYTVEWADLRYKYKVRR